MLDEVTLPTVFSRFVTAVKTSLDSEG
jgi:hypothetical protein